MYRSLHPFASVHVHLPKAISILVTRPPLVAVADGGRHPKGVVIALPFIGEDHGIGQGKSMNKVSLAPA